jgi:glucose-1-phosphatase
MLALFDLGGVIVDVDLNWARDAWCETTGGSNADFDRVFLDSGVKDRIDRGEMSESQALDKVRQLFGQELQDEQIRASWTSCLRARPYSGQLVHAVAQRTRCAVLSNTDPMHSAWIEEHSGVNESISQWVYSYQCGSMKPEAAIFRFALNELCVEAEQTLLIDDRPENVAAARDLGMNAIHYTSFEVTCIELVRYGLLPAGWAPS